MTSVASKKRERLDKKDWRKRQVSIDVRPWLVKKQEAIDTARRFHLDYDVSEQFVVTEDNRRKARAWDELLRMIEYGKC